MKRETLKALNGSIAKCGGVRAGGIRDLGNENCPLCHLFLEACCDGCPVSQRTGKPYCAGSPYLEWVDAGGDGVYATTKKLKRIASAEIKFLKSLLPK